MGNRGVADRWLNVVRTCVSWQVHMGVGVIAGRGNKGFKVEGGMEKEMREQRCRGQPSLLPAPSAYFSHLQLHVSSSPIGSNWKSHSSANSAFLRTPAQSLPFLRRVHSLNIKMLVIRVSMVSGEEERTKDDQGLSPRTTIL